MDLFGHPFSSYTWKALIPLYENGTPFEFRMLGPDNPENFAEFASLWPIAKFPLLRDGETAIFEATAIIEHLSAFHPGAVAFIPANPALAVETRMLDRVFDNYVMTLLQAFVDHALRSAEDRDPIGVDRARRMLDTIYGWLDGRLDGREWANGSNFSLADCAAAPSLFYADWVHPIDKTHANLRAYRARLLARPSVARTVDEARPYRALFPLGAPNRD